MAALVFATEIAWDVPDTIAAPSLALFISAYSLGAHAQLRPAAAGLALVLLGMPATSIAQGVGLGDFAFIGAICAGGWTAGRVVRSRRVLAAQLADRAAVLEHQRDEQALAAAAAERARIACELHDVVAHCVNVMVLQAGAERRAVAEERPETAATLRAIEDTGREALAELRRLLGIVRRDGGEPPLEPQPTLAHLDQLIERMRSSGTEVDVEISGDVRPLSPGLELSAFRIVQEALTNTTKHAPGSPATVALRYQPSALELEIVDRGAPEAGPRAGTGKWPGADRDARARSALCRQL